MQLGKTTVLRACRDATPSLRFKSFTGTNVKSNYVNEKLQYIYVHVSKSDAFYFMWFIGGHWPQPLFSPKEKK